jgi:hypothetical protein
MNEITKKPDLAGELRSMQAPLRLLGKKEPYLLIKHHDGYTQTGDAANS